jgi:hypothetical protein
MSLQLSEKIPRNLETHKEIESDELGDYIVAII